MELHSFARMDTRISAGSQTSLDEVRHWQVETHSLVEMSAWKIYWPDLHADSEAYGPAIIGRIYGTPCQFAKCLPRQHEKEKCCKKKQLHRQYE